MDAFVTRYQPHASGLIGQGGVPLTALSGDLRG
jgi:hypothetical protein